MPKVFLPKVRGPPQICVLGFGFSFPWGTHPRIAHTESEFSFLLRMNPPLQRCSSGMWACARCALHAHSHVFLHTHPSLTAKVKEIPEEKTITIHTLQFCCHSKLPK